MVDQTDAWYDPEGADQYWSCYPLPTCGVKVSVCPDAQWYRSTRFDLGKLDELADLLRRRPGTVLYVPKVVMEECRNEHDKMTKRALGEFCPEVRAKLKAVLSEHQRQWFSKLRQVARIQTDISVEAIQRAFGRVMRRQAPCRSGKEMRDAVILETLIECAARGDAISILITADKGYPISDEKFRKNLTEARAYCFETLTDLKMWFEPALRQAEWVTTTTTTTPGPVPLVEKILSSPPDLAVHWKVVNAIRVCCRTKHPVCESLEILDASLEGAQALRSEEDVHGQEVELIKEEWSVHVQFRTTAEPFLATGSSIRVPALAERWFRLETTVKYVLDAEGAIVDSIVGTILLTPVKEHVHVQTAPGEVHDIIGLFTQDDAEGESP